MRILSGIQPSGEIHLGNYIGALRHWVARQKEFESFYLLADLHAITVARDPKILRDRTLSTAALLFAIGVDPARSAVFVQSHVSEHAELAWILNCVASFGELRRMTQFKDKMGRKETTTVGSFAYPVLQSADILLYQPDHVPVGEDQKQHLELTRDLALRFNARFGETFKVPEPMIGPVGARIMDLKDPRKEMSKSSEVSSGVIWLTDTSDMIRAKIRNAVTDSGRELNASDDKPAISNLLTIYSIVSNTTIEAVEQEFAGTGYGSFKNALADVLIAYIQPLQQRLKQWSGAHEEIMRILRRGAERERAATRRRHSIEQKNVWASCPDRRNFVEGDQMVCFIASLADDVRPRLPWSVKIRCALLHDPEGHSPSVPEKVFG
jgi:tryptophanyl-tRNA synthetase